MASIQKGNCCAAFTSGGPYSRIIPPLRAKFSQRSTPLFEYTLLLIVIAQVAFLSYMNLFEAPKMIDYDGAKLYKHAIEMWENKSLFIPGWKYITTMELDCSLFLALPIYAVSHNIFTSFGIANIIILSIFKRTRLQKGYALLSVSLVLMPYVSGMLEYFNMMFFNGSQYTVKVMVPLLFILLVTTEEDGRKKAGNIAAMVLYTLWGTAALKNMEDIISVCARSALPLFYAEP